MLKFAAAALALAVMAPFAMAQTGPSSGVGQTPAQNSGAGVAGQPGNKNGPAARTPSGTMGAGGSSSQAPAGEAARPQDTSKVPGLPGNKSGPAAKPPSTSSDH